MNKNTEYEKFAQEIYQELMNSQGFSTIDVQHNVKLTGKSGQKHQIDVYWEYEIKGERHKVVIECKNYNRKIVLGKVRDFYGLLSDLENVFGIIITKRGYQEGAKRYADYYGIKLLELRTPSEKVDDFRIGDFDFNIGISLTQCVFSLDDDWAKANNIDWRLHRSSTYSFSERGHEWGDDYLSLETTKDEIFDEKGKVIATLKELSDELPQKAEHIYDFENAYVYSRYLGRVKIRAVKYINKKWVQRTIYTIDARDAVKAILKNVSSGKTLVFWKGNVER